MKGSFILFFLIHLFYLMLPFCSVFEILFSNIPFFFFSFASAGTEKATGLHISAAFTRGQSSSRTPVTVRVTAFIHYCVGRNHHVYIALVRRANEVMLCWDAKSV